MVHMDLEHHNLVLIGFKTKVEPNKPTLVSRMEQQADVIRESDIVCQRAT